MKRFRKLSVALCLSLMICLTASTILPTCMDSLTTAQAATATSGTKVKLNKTKATIYNGATLQLKLKGTNEKVKWSSSSKKIATVDKNGKVTAKKKGKATITAKVGNKKYTCKLTVKPAFELLESTDKSISLKPGDKTEILLKLHLKKMGKGVTYSISDKKVIKCKWYDTDHDILDITALKPGEATITFKNKLTKDTIKAKVTVKEHLETPAPTVEPTPEPTPIPDPLTVDQNAVVVNKGETISVKVTWLLDSTIKYINGDTSVVSLKWGDWIDRDTCELFITGKKVGNTNVTICDKTETYSVSIMVVVTALARPADNVPGEISGLLGENIYVANNKLGQTLTYNNGYYMDNCVGFATYSNKNIKYVGIRRNTKGYKIFGVYPGMSFGVANEKLGDYGWILITSGPTSSGEYSYAYLQTGNPGKMIVINTPTSDISSLVSNVAYAYTD